MAPPRVNPVKLKQDADKLEKAGQLDKAIAVYRQLVDDNPSDWNTVKKIGDLYARLNKTREAIEEWAKVADFFAKDGFLLKSIALWKQINKLDPSAVEPALNLADLYAKQGLMMEAKSQYQGVVDEYIKRGKMRDAGDVLKKMADIDPSDLRIRSRLADLYPRLGYPEKAIEEHIAIAEELNKKGHLAEALQVLERGLKIDAKNNRLRLELARIHLVQKNYERAVHYLEEAVERAPNDPRVLLRLGEAYVGAKKAEDAEIIFRRLIKLDPNDQESRIQMGRVYLLQGLYDKAYDEFLPVVEKLLERKDVDQAAALLQQVVQRNSAHIPSLVKLVDMYRSFKKDTAAATTYSQLTEAYLAEGQIEKAEAVLEMLVSMEPQNQQHRTKLEFVRSKQPRSASPAPAPDAGGRAAPMEEEFEEDPSLLSFIEDDEPATAPPAAAGRLARPKIELSGPLSDEDREFIEEHVAEGRVFRKYGLVDKAADQFESVIARFPDNVEARQELRDISKEKGLTSQVAEQYLALAEICRLKGDAAGAESNEDEARRLVPVAAPTEAPVPVPPAPPPPAPPPPAPPPQAPPPPEPAIRAVREAPPVEEEEVLDEEEIPLDEDGIEDAPESTGLDFSDSAPLSNLDFQDDPGEDEGLPEAFIDDEPALPASPSFDAPTPEAEGLLIGDAPATTAPFADEDEFAELAEPPSPPPLSLPAEALAPDAARGVPLELQRVLDEVDEYIAVGFVDDAKDALREIGARYAGHPALLRKAADLGLELEAVAPEAPFEVEDQPPLHLPALENLPQDADDQPDEPEVIPPPPDTVRFEAIREPVDEGGGLDLEDLFGAQSAVVEAVPTMSTDLGDAGLADIFKEFKKGVDKQLGKEDYDTRYNLGIAYKEMGLVDEAIAEFQLAAKDEGRLLECSSMLGICFMEKGMPKLAIKWFEKGLKAPGRSDEEYQGLRYDLAMAHEAAGEVDKALNMFTDLYGQDANFRDVASKVRDLRAALG